MFIGHFAVAMGAKKIAPKVNLGVLLIACQLLALIWPVLVLLGIERVSVDYLATAVTPLNFEYYPFSHSLLMSLILSVILGLSCGFIYKSKKIAFILAGTTLSHWFLDFLTHRPDLPLYFNSAKYGLGLWNYKTLSIAIEVCFFIIGIYLYLSTKKLTKKKQMSFWSLILLLLLIYYANVLGPKPPLDTPSEMIAGPALAMWLIVLWGYWIDK